MEWYPKNKEELDTLLDKFLSLSAPAVENIHGLIVPHAGYQFSGEIAGMAFSLLKGKGFDRAVVMSPSHYASFYGIASLKKIKTPLGEMKIEKNNLPKLDYEHAIDNQIPFLQKLGIKRVFPVLIGEVSFRDSEKISEEIIKILSRDKKSVLIVSTDLSHFLAYEMAIEADRKTIEIIENLDLSEWDKIDACGKFSLLVLMHLCIKKKWRPKLVEYKNSGDIFPETRYQGVVGYASFWF